MGLEEFMDPFRVEGGTEVSYEVWPAVGLRARAGGAVAGSQLQEGGKVCHTHDGKGGDEGWGGLGGAGAFKGGVWLGRLG